MVKGACTTNLRAMDIFAILGTGLEVGGQLAKETFYLVNGFMKAADSPLIEGQMKCKICATCLQKETFCNFFLWLFPSSYFFSPFTGYSFLNE